MSPLSVRRYESARSVPSAVRPTAFALLTTFALLGGASAAAQPLQIQGEAVRQIAALMAEKAARTPAQQKIASQLLYELRMRHGSPAGITLPTLRGRLEVAADGTVLVDLDAAVSDELLAQITGAGGQVVSAFPRFAAVRARLPLTALEGVAASPAVRSIRPADRMFTQMINTTEGDVAHGTDEARVDFGVTGAGVQACAMSDSVDALAALQASGDLPPGVTVLPGQSGNPGTSEGTALLEIIFDMAPGADLFFATGQGGQAQMAQNILDLRDAGCDVIVDDVLYFSEAVFQDGVIAQAVDEVHADNVLYVTSAGNSGNLSHGTAGVWEGDYLATALPGPLTGAGLSAHNFGGGANSNQLTADSPFFFTLQWADPLAGSDNDFDLFLLNAALTTVLDASTTTQNGTQNPLEAIDTTVDNDLNNRLVVVHFAGDPRFLHLNTHRGRLQHATDGQIFGHPGAEGALTIGAVDVATAGGGQFTGGPANPIEAFSSDGPRRIFFLPDGTPLPVAQAADGAPIAGSAGFIERQKPDLAAADGVSTATPGFNPFFGTSASAPHIAGLSTIFREGFKSAPVNFFINSLRSNAFDIEDPGFDSDSGFGIPTAGPIFEGPIFSDGFESGDTSSWSN